MLAMELTQTMYKTLCICWILSVAGICATDRTIDMSNEKRLITDLINNYDVITTFGRPVKNSSNSVGISFGLGLIRMDVEEKSNMLVLSAWSKYKWKDEYLTWKPDDYGGIQEVALETKHIWIPDIMLYNTASTEKFERAVNLVVDYNGTVRWFPHRIFYSTCSIDVRDFPFDNQTCHLWFGSWTHKISAPGYKLVGVLGMAMAVLTFSLCLQRRMNFSTYIQFAAVDLQLNRPDGIDLTTFRSDFKETSKWDVTGVLANRIEDEMAVLTFTLYLQRRMIFSSYILTFPVIFMSFLTLLVFWLPSDHADKSNLGMTIFGSLLLLLLILVESAPPTSAAVPKLGIYYCFNIVIVMLSIFLSSVITHVGGIGKTSGKPVPLRIKKLFRMPTGNMYKPANGIPYSKSVREQRSDDEMGQLLDIFKSTTTEGTAGGTDKLCSALHGYISQRKLEERRHQELACIQQEWSQVATMMDRLVMLVYFLVIIASLIWLFPR